MNRQMKTMRIATQKRARSIGENGTCGGHGKNRDITTGEFDRKIDHANRVNYQFLTLCTFQGEGGGDKEWKGSQGEGDEKRGEREGEREKGSKVTPRHLLLLLLLLLLLILLLLPGPISPPLVAVKATASLPLKATRWHHLSPAMQIPAGTRPSLPSVHYRFLPFISCQIHSF